MTASAMSKSLLYDKTVFDLWLYVVEQSPWSMLAYANLETVCAERLSGRYRINVVDLLAYPDVARTEGFVAVPTIVRRRAKPVRTAIRDLSGIGHLPAWLGLVRQY